MHKVTELKYLNKSVMSNGFSVQEPAYELNFVSEIKLYELFYRLFSLLGLVFSV